MSDSIEGAKTLADLAQINLPADRARALAGGLEMTRRIAEALARIDYGDIAPEVSFRAPRKSS